MAQHDDDPRSRGEPKVISAEAASQGQTVLRTPLRKVIFLGGLALAVIVALVLGHHGGR